MNKLTKKQGAIIGAYTGYLAGKFSDMHEYIEEIMNRSVFTHELADKTFAMQIKEKATKDFLEICAD
jgi:hypothetical protein